MKVPSPPLFDPLQHIPIIANAMSSIPATVTDEKGRYQHWDKLRRLPLPDGFSSHEEYWHYLKFCRKTSYTSLPLGEDFVYILTDEIMQSLHLIDSQTHGMIDSKVPKDNKKYITDSFIDEAIHSSQLEGASTTRKVARQMLLEESIPKNHSEKMIYNNYQAISFIKEYKNEEVTPQTILELHRIISDKTLKDNTECGTFRTTNDIAVVDSTNNTILYEPPDYTTLDNRINELCKFINGENFGKQFIHPVVRAIIVHFMLAYLHPFSDGNGRTARALFYLVLLKNNYWLFEYISLSRYIYKAPAEYAKSFLYVETDKLDLSYFLIGQLDFIRQAIDDMSIYIKDEKQRSIKAKQLVHKYLRDAHINPRQALLLQHALENSGEIYTISRHKVAHSTSYQTAKTDLMGLHKLGLLEFSKSGREFIFISPNDLRKRIMNYQK